MSNRKGRSAQVSATSKKTFLASNMIATLLLKKVRNLTGLSMARRQKKEMKQRMKKASLALMQRKLQYREVKYSLIKRFPRYYQQELSALVWMEENTL
jgi:hypothetical protein